MSYGERSAQVDQLGHGAIRGWDGAAELVVLGVAEVSGLKAGTSARVSIDRGVLNPYTPLVCDIDTSHHRDHPEWRRVGARSPTAHKYWTFVSAASSAERVPVSALFCKYK